MTEDIHTTAGKIEDLRKRLDEAVHAGSARAIEKQHAKGKMTARERIEKLVDAGSFTELDEFARHRSIPSYNAITIWSAILHSKIPRTDGGQTMPVG